MGGDTGIIFLLAILILGFVALAGLRIKNNNKVYGAETDTYAATFRMFQGQIERLNKDSVSSSEKLAHIQGILHEANMLVGQLKLDLDNANRKIARLKAQIKELGAEPVE